MSAEEIQQIIRRSVIDKAFAKALKDNPHQALREYALTPVEFAALRAMQIEFDTTKRQRTPSRKYSRSKSSKSRGDYQLD